MRTKREPTYRTVAKLVAHASVLLYFIPSAVLLYAAVSTGQTLYWLCGVLLLFSGVMVARAAWGLRK